MAHIYLQDTDFTLWHGDVSDALRQMDDESMDCVVTSPPYWGLRDYGTGQWEGGDAECEHQGSERYYTEKSAASSSSEAFSEAGEANAERLKKARWREDGDCVHCGARRIDHQLGLEPTPEQYVERMVEVFREVRRVLAAGGTLWLNLGDSYAQGSKGNSGAIRPGDKQGTNAGSLATRRGAGLGPNRNGGTRDTCKPKDLVGIPWMVAFALRSDGWYLRSDIIWAKPNPMPESVTDRPTKSHEYIFLLSKNPRYYFDQEAVREPAEWNRWGDQTNAKYEGSQSSAGWIKPKSKEELLNLKRSSYPSAATGGNSLDGHVSKSDEGLPVNPAGRNIRSVWQISTQSYAEAHFAVFPEELAKRCIIAGCPEGGVVLDPFMGSGTVAYVARGFGRRSVGIELSESYCQLIADRMKQLSLFG